VTASMINLSFTSYESCSRQALHLCH